MGYHSALNKPIEAAPVNRAIFKDGLAFAHDIRNGLPSEYDICDVFYTDLPWRDGFAIFEARAGAVKASQQADVRSVSANCALVAPRPDYAAFLHDIRKILLHGTPKPTVLVTGRQSMPYLPMPGHIYPTKLNGADAVALSYSCRLAHTQTATDILEELAQRFNVVGDFCCGYGRTANIFRNAGKRFVVSDFNPSCIGYIAREFAAS